MKVCTLPVLAIGLFSLFIMAGCTTSRNTAGAANNTDDIGKLLEQKSFEFIPQTVLPTGGRSRQVTSEFFLRVRRDTIQSYLPYFGRSFSGVTDPSRGGMDFTTNNFGYQVSQGKKDATIITIEPRSGTDVRQLTLEIFPNGNASVRAQSNNRTAIAYNGFIRAIRR